MIQIKIDSNLRLELTDESHAESIFNLVDNNRAYLKQWLPWVDSTQTVENTKEYIKMTLKRYAENNGFDCSIIFNDEIAGLIGLHKIDHSNKITSIGYWLGEDYQHKGIMTKTVVALLNYCFNSLELNRIELKCASENYRSQAIPERLNFKKEGIIRQGEFLNGKYVDLFLYSLLKEEW